MVILGAVEVYDGNVAEAGIPMTVRKASSQFRRTVVVTAECTQHPCADGRGNDLGRRVLGCAFRPNRARDMHDPIAKTGAWLKQMLPPLLPR
jgi:hypothetical protein